MGKRELDLTQCKPGDKLLLRNGKTVTVNEFSDLCCLARNRLYPICVEDDTGKITRRTQEGRANTYFDKMSVSGGVIDQDEDVIEVLVEPKLVCLECAYTFDNGNYCSNCGTRLKE